MFPGMHFIIYLLDTWNEKNINEYVGFFFCLYLCKLSSYLIGVKELFLFFLCCFISLIELHFPTLKHYFFKEAEQA